MVGRCVGSPSSGRVVGVRKQSWQAVHPGVERRLSLHISIVIVAIVVFIFIFIFVFVVVFASVMLVIRLMEELVPS